ncbi:sister chromatid cohesion protein PDS5 [Chryseobacterium sp. SSA4.19]|uniref:sister chromatid cohesion protein PDS5 n=1 Tax=Chryseobacterium sp. SSA4.19 TaxID=2919915 RepID=UPI001F4E492C|nr:sister chromatid cohesion protein PDS5 [Chryseobacterium sp. SSA4.19]MCJ8153443.1 sister chromatid cohesion protein PDS5 [Chryseobacterium sp. SSA4.19]
MNNKFNKLINSDATKIVTSLIEVPLDSYFDNDIISKIPVLKTFIDIYNLGTSVSDKIFANKLIHFLNELEDISSELILKEIQYIDDSEKYNHKVGEKIIEILNRIDSDGKPKIIGRLFRNFIDKKIEYSVFLKFADIVEKTFYYDLLSLRSCTDGKFYFALDEQLYNIGLVEGTGIGSFNATEEERVEFNQITALITQKGKILLEFGLK